MEKKNKKPEKKKAAPKPKGRPTIYTKKIANEICERTAKGESLMNICKDESMPGLRTVYDWKDEKREFSARFTRAREIGCDVMAAECLEIADDNKKDNIIVQTPGGAYQVEDKEWTSRAKLRVETRLKLLAKWNPQKYGDKLDVTTDGDKINRTSPELLKGLADAINKHAKQ